MPLLKRIRRTALKPRLVVPNRKLGYWDPHGRFQVSWKPLQPSAKNHSNPDGQVALYLWATVHAGVVRVGRDGFSL